MSGFDIAPFKRAAEIDALERSNHNHWTRDIKPRGLCPACDRVAEAYQRAVAEGR